MKNEISIEQVAEKLGREETIHLYRTAQRRRRMGISLEVAAAIVFGIALLVLMFFVGCATRTTYTTLAATEKAVVSAYDGYLDSVIKGQTRTNEVPVITGSFNTFQATMRTAVDAASGNTGAPVSGDVASAAANFIQTVTNTKGKK